MARAAATGQGSLGPLGPLEPILVDPFSLVILHSRNRTILIVSERADHVVRREFVMQ